MPSLKIPKLLRANPTETWLVIVLLLISVGLSLSSDKFFTIANLFNLLNTSSVIDANFTYGAKWLNPVQILAARMAKLSVQIRF